MKKKYLHFLILFLIFLVGFTLRFYRLGINLPPLYADETNGHYWYWLQINNPNTSIIKRILLMILYTPDSIVWLAGFSTFYARFMSALNGSFFVLFTYLFSSAVYLKEKYNKQAISLVVAALVAVLPWSFMISRIYGSFPFILILLSIHYFLFLKAKTITEYFISLFPLLITSFIYPSFFIITPLAVLIVFYQIWRLFNIKEKRIFSVVLIPFVCLGILLLVQRFNLLNNSSRGLDLAIWRDINTTYDTDRYRSLSWNSESAFFSFNLPPEHLADKIFYNRLVANISIFTRNYLSFFSPEWLFLRGDPILRHSTGLIGEFYPFLIPFLIYGIYIFSLISDKKTKKLFVFWIIISPIPAAITKDGYGYLLRAITMMPFLTYFCGLGIVESFKVFKNKWKLVYGIILGLVAIYSIYFFFFGYFHVYPSLSERSYEYGFKELSDFQVIHDNKSLVVIWDGYYHNGDFRFWQQTSNNDYNAFTLNKINIGSSDFWQTYPNLFFTNTKSKEDLKNFISKYHPAYVVLPDKYFVNYPDEILTLLGNQIETIYNPDKSPALKIYELNSVIPRIK